MSPDKRSRRSRTPRSRDILPAQSRPSSDDPHRIVYFRRSDGSGSSPGREFLRGLPPKVRATMNACVIAVAKAPPKRFAGGGYWEAMHGEMTGWFEVRVDGPGRVHHRLFCRLDYEAEDSDQPLLVIITGMSKPFRTTFSDKDYAVVRALGGEYFAKNPRSII